MSLSLSSLLNPSPDAETGQSSSPTDLLPPLQHAQSPIELQNGSPNSAPPSNRQFTYPPPSRDEAAQALASLSASPVAPPQQWSGYTAQDPNQLEQQRSWERRQSGYGDPMQLPPPPPGAAPRKMSSPTLDQYHVASRSPEQQRASAVLPTQSHITLAPILPGYTPFSAESAKHHAHAQNGDMAQHPGPLAEHSPIQNGSHVDPSYNSDLVQADDRILPPELKTQTLNISAPVEPSSPALIKQEAIPTPQPSSPADHHPPADTDLQMSKTVSSLKNEQGVRTQSPLREASVPVPTTETAAAEQQTAAYKRQTAPAKRKKGTASAVKKEKAPPAKKRKVEPKRSATPSSRASKGPATKGNSSKGTPANSSPAPSARSYSGEPNEEPYNEDDEDMEDDPDADLYCICRKPDNGTFMIGCDGACDDWFHGKCVGIEERDKNLIDKYICPSCTEQGIGRTTFKKMCRRSGCRQPARVGKTKSGNNGSKYCSEECGVTYFREMVARTRGREESSKNRVSRGKSIITGPEKASLDDELGARGGALSAREIKALLDASGTVEEFKKLGDGVLSPPATPDGNEQETKDRGFTVAETEALQRISMEKEEARRRHTLLKDRMKFVTLVKQAANRITQERELKPKEYCGYDPRLEWSESQFQAWRNSKIGQQAFELETLEVEKGSGTDGELPQHAENPHICDRKKCARHHDWSKLAVDEIRFEMGDNSDRMRTLATEETEMKERAALRAKGGNIAEGTVEIHGWSITTGDDKMEVESPSKSNGIVDSVEQPVVVGSA